MTSWAALVRILRETIGEDGAAVVVRRAELELQGERVTVPRRSRPTDDQIAEALRTNGYHVVSAARALGVSPGTLYRRLRRRQRPL